ncbi:MAG: threonine ammonia-lyase [Myxococcota bacterium]
MITFTEIEEARERIKGSVSVTPCSYSTLLSESTKSKVYLKLENLQITGSFKERGACNKLMTLTPQERSAGVIAASAGNHAQAIAYHGSRLGVSTKIVMPEGTPLVKITRTKAFGAEVVLHGPNYDEAYAHAMELGACEGRAFAHPFNDRAVIAGQGTIGLELLEQYPYLDAVLVAIGGGGLISGVAAAIKETNPKIKVIGVEPEGVNSMAQAVAAGEPVDIDGTQTLADGVAVRKVGELTLANVMHYVDDIVTVSEAQIASAILTLLEQEKTVAEGAGAAPVAALLNDVLPSLRGKRVCPIVCGGNIDVNVIARIIERGLVAAGRLWAMECVITDTPGSLAALLTHIGKLKANVLEVAHNRTFTSGDAFGTTRVELKLETRGDAHIRDIRRALIHLNYDVLTPHSSPFDLDGTFPLT